MDTRDGFRWVQQIEPCCVMGWRLYNLRVGDFFGCFQLEVLGVQLSKREHLDMKKSFRGVSQKIVLD